jgi:SAM-dependent methyltransferase
MNAMDRHLDLGCGKFPRNPYGRSQLYGIDVRDLPGEKTFDYRVANLVLDSIPHGDDSFGSVSAYDFIEHVPRILLSADGSTTVFPFIRLMNEIWRVLAPGGRFYAVTPAFPHTEAFTDPTHVNIITEETHAYFCGDKPMARMYGFAGQFKVLRADWVRIQEVYSAIPGSAENRKPRGPLKRFARLLRGVSRALRGKPDNRHGAYLLWELEAVKPAAR